MKKFLLLIVNLLFLITCSNVSALDLGRQPGEDAFYSIMLFKTDQKRAKPDYVIEAKTPSLMEIEKNLYGNERVLIYDQSTTPINDSLSDIRKSEITIINNYAFLRIDNRFYQVGIKIEGKSDKSVNDLSKKDKRLLTNVLAESFNKIALTPAALALSFTKESYVITAYKSSLTGDIIIRRSFDTRSTENYYYHQCFDIAKLGFIYDYERQ